MKTFFLLEKSKNFWFLILTSIIFFFLRLPSFVEPYWYGDEGIYQVIGMALIRGRLLYKEIWDNKPPLLYLIYALFNSDQFAIRLVSLIFGLLSVLVFFLIAKEVFPKSKLYLFSTSFFALLFATPLIEGNIANAENFMLLPILISAFILTKTNSYKNNVKKDFRKYKLDFIAGILLGIGYLFKIVAIFDFAAFFLFVFISNFNKKNSFRDTVKSVFPFPLGFLVPIILTTLVFIFNGAFNDYLQATFFQNINYVSYGNSFIVPQGLLILKTVILGIFVLFLFKSRERLPKTNLFILLWLIFSLFNALFSQRPYTHYLLVLLPSFSLMLGLLFWDKKFQKLNFILLTIALLLIIKNFSFSYAKTFLYYGNFFSFLTGTKTVRSYQAFFDTKTPIDYEIAQFIKPKITNRDYLFIWGNNAQVYKMVGSLPPGRYAVAYHITSYRDGLKDTQQGIDKFKPKFIIAMPDQKPIPFSLLYYSKRITIDNVDIYERVF